MRAANTGISAVIDAYGRVRHYLPLYETGVIDAFLPAAISEPTFHSRYARWFTGCVILLTGLFITCQRFYDISCGALLDGTCFIYVMLCSVIKGANVSRVE